MSDNIRYARLGYVALCVTDLATSIRFYQQGMGLELAHQDGTSARFRCSDKPHDLMLQQAPEPGVLRAAFELESTSEWRKAFDRVAALGLAPTPVPESECVGLRVDSAFRFSNPHSGLTIEFYYGQQKSTPFAQTVTNIARLGHVVLNVANFDEEFDLWVNKLGFAVSDHVPGRIAFLRCFPNPLHHSLALIGGDVNGLNHVNFMVTDIDDVGRAIYRMRKIGAPIVFGPGRHKPSESIFLYFLDPDGMTMEFSFGMELFDEIDARAPRVLEPTPETLDMWGGVPSPEFGKVGQIITAHG